MSKGMRSKEEEEEGGSNTRGKMALPSLPIYSADRFKCCAFRRIDMYRNGYIHPYIHFWL